MGMCLVTNLGFADDLLLYSTSLEQLQKIMCDFKRSTEKVGLKFNPEKTNILAIVNCIKFSEGLAKYNVSIVIHTWKLDSKYVHAVECCTFRKKRFLACNKNVKNSS